MPLCSIVQDIFVGRPKAITDERGTWTSSIFRDGVDGPIEVLQGGLAGDKVAQPYHGSPGAAVCVHLADHYRFWRDAYGLDLRPGSFGENLTVAGLAEDEVCAGDTVRVGTAIVQVSGPRVPCANLARRMGRPDWVKLTIRENRTGFYLRVLEPGVLQAGDAWIVEERSNEVGSIAAINRCMYLQFDPDFARKILDMQGLAPWWKEQAREKLGANGTHWTSAMKDGGAS